MATERYHMLLDWRGEHNITFAAPGQQIGKARPLPAMLSTTPYCLKFTQRWSLRACMEVGILAALGLSLIGSAAENLLEKVMPHEIAARGAFCNQGIVTNAIQ